LAHPRQGCGCEPMIKSISEMLCVAAIALTLAFGVIWAFTDAAVTEASLPRPVHIERVMR
jgi:hypothetical protein